MEGSEQKETFLLRVKDPTTETKIFPQWSKLQSRFLVCNCRIRPIAVIAKHHAVIDTTIIVSPTAINIQRLRNPRLT